MKSTKFWIQLIVMVSAIACFSSLVIASLGAGVGATAKEPESRPAAQSSEVQLQTYEGVITDTHCGAKHSTSIAETAGDCTRVCVHAGERFVLVDGDNMYVLEGEPQALKRAAGERVRIAGTLNGKTISVTSVRPSAS